MGKACNAAKMLESLDVCCSSDRATAAVCRMPDMYMTCILFCSLFFSPFPGPRFQKIQKSFVPPPLTHTTFSIRATLRS